MIFFSRIHFHWALISCASRAADPPHANAILKIVEHGARLVPKNYEYQSILKSVLKCLRAAVVLF